MRISYHGIVATLVAAAAAGGGSRSSANAAATVSEHDILVEFYQALNGPSWNNNYGWEDDSGDYCTWYGVVCNGEEKELNNAQRLLLEKDDENRRNLASSSVTIPQTGNGKIIGLELKSNNLQGRIPASLWDLPNLRILHLTSNAVDVAFVGRSDTLVELKMHSTDTNTLTGISRFPNLLSLHLSETPLGQIEFPQELFKLTKLNFLHMASCQLQGIIPEQIFDLTALEELNLYNNEFTGLIPAGLEFLTNLKLLTLSLNHFHGRLPEWLGTKLTNLEQLYMESNMLTGQLLSFSQSPNLSKLYLDGNELTDNIPSDFLAGVKDNGQTIHVNLDNNRLGAIVPDSLDALESLPLKITLAGNLFTGFNSDVLCDNVNWMDGDVDNYGCDAILCPIRTSATLGRHTAGSVCTPCKSGTTIGQMTCLDQDDRRTLQFLYAETGGDHWFRNDNWMDDSKSVCDWYGIKCYTDKDPGGHAGRVRRVQLHDNGLIGSISSHIFALDVATEIDLSWNKIQFPFQEIGLTRSLHILNIGHTDTTSLDGFELANPFFEIFLADRLSIDGTIPTQIFQNTNLQILSLNNCGLSGNIPTLIGSLTNLKELYLWGNDLRGSIPSEIGLLTNLRIVSLAKNQLTGTLPASIEGLVSLEALTVQDQVTKGGGLTGNLLAFQYTSAVSNLILRGNKFDGSIPESMVNSVNIDSSAGTLILDLSDNQLTGSVPGSLAKFDEMDLFVENNHITSVNPLLCSKRDWMSGNVGEYGCDAILCPEFTFNPLGRQAFDNFDCKSCPTPDPKNPSVGQTSCTGKVAILTERQILEMIYKQCGGAQWTHNENWMSTSNFCEWYGIACDDAKSVVSIVLGSNNMKGSIPKEIFSLPNLQRLSIFSNPVDFSFDGIDAAVNLKSLILDDSQVTSIQGVGKARSLTELNIRANNLVGTLPDEIADLNNLRSLVVSSNKFTGTLPNWLTKLNKLTNLMLDDNQFTGTLIPFETYPDITLISISKNKLTGTVPAEFLSGAARDAKIFCDLSSNMITGTIPGALYRLNRLSLHLQNNRIQGISGELCRMQAWNDYDIQNYGCSGLLCPSGTFNPKGRQSSADSNCTQCPQNQYFGSTQCSSGTSMWLSGLVMVAGFVAALLASA